MNADEALAFVSRHGAVLASAKGAAPRLSEAIAGMPIQGSWWSHPHGRGIYAVLQALEQSPEILVCRLLEGRVSLVHRRLWPALVRLAPRFAAGRLDQVRQEHTAAGHHQSHALPFPQWVPPDVLQQAQQLSEAQAETLLGDSLAAALKPGPKARGGKPGKVRP